MELIRRGECPPLTDVVRDLDARDRQDMELLLYVRRKTLIISTRPARLARRLMSFSGSLERAVRPPQKAEIEAFSLDSQGVGAINARTFVDVIVDIHGRWCVVRDHVSLLTSRGSMRYTSVFHHPASITQRVKAHYMTLYGEHSKIFRSMS